MPIRDQASSTAPGRAMFETLLHPEAKEQKDIARLRRFLEHTSTPTGKTPAYIMLVAPEEGRESSELEPTPRSQPNKAQLPAMALGILRDILAVLEHGDAVAITVSFSREITTQQAATLLNVPHRYLLTLLDENRLPFEKKGRQCRIPLEALLKFKEQRSQQRSQALDELLRLSEEAGAYQDEWEEGA